MQYLISHGQPEKGMKNLTKLRKLPADHDYLLEGGVFTSDLIEKWVELKRDDVTGLRLRPHPYEFELYYDV